MATKFSILPITFADISVLAKMSADGFLIDRHTQMKTMGKNPYDHEGGSKASLASYLTNERCVCLKAVSDETGEAMGFIIWGSRGFEKGEIPRSDPPDTPALVDEESSKNEEDKVDERKEGGKENEEEEDDDIIKRLVAMTDADMKHWMERLMPEGTKCIFVIGLSVSPKFQSQGVGSALLKCGTNICDKFGVFAWVHSSEAGWKAYAKAGFEIVGTLDVDLDAWAPVPPPAEEGPGAVWGHYVFRYMKYLPKKA